MLSRYFSLLISPLGFSLALLAFALIQFALKRNKLGIIFVVSVFLWLWIWSTPLASYLLQYEMESTYPPLSIDAVPNADATVVLGGAVRPPSVGFPYANLAPAADRVWHAARLYRAGKARWVVLSGGADLSLAQESEAKAMAGFIEDLGVPSSALILEEQSRTTSQNASMTAKLLKDRNVHHILLVTSALHMERAKRLFEKQGLQVEAIATDHEATVMPVGALAYLPDAEALSNSAIAMKELAGRVAGLLGIDR